MIFSYISQTFPKILNIELDDGNICRKPLYSMDFNGKKHGFL